MLIAAETWQRKHVDWEIGSSIRHTDCNPRSGLLGILLPAYPRPAPGKYNPYTIPPRPHDNIKCGFASIHNWSEDAATVQDLDSPGIPAHEAARQLSSVIRQEPHGGSMDRLSARAAYEIRLPGGRALKTTPVFDTYWRFASERQEMFMRRVLGSTPPWTEAPILSVHRFTNTSERRTA